MKDYLILAAAGLLVLIGLSLWGSLGPSIYFDIAVGAFPLVGGISALLIRRRHERTDLPSA